MAVQQLQGLRRTDLQQHDLGLPGYEVIQNRVEIEPEAPAVGHWHPGEEIIYVLEGTLEYEIDGRPNLTVTAGGALTVPAETVHAVRISQPDAVTEVIIAAVAATSREPMVA